MEAAERLGELERAMGEATVAVLELANVAELHAQALHAQRRRLERLRLLLLLIVLGTVVRWLTACSGAAFETSNPTGSQLAGAQSSAGAQAAGGAAALSGGAGGVAGGNTAGNSAGAAGDPPDVLGGAGGELGGSSSSGGAGGVAPCLAGWQGSACDTCTPAAAPATGETCAELLGCYLANNGPGNCDYVKPTADAVVQIAHDVLACRGGCL